MAAQHAGLSEERWAAFSLGQQVLMIANDMNRARKLMLPEDRGLRLAAYERVLRLVDLTVAVHARRGLRRELLRWRDLIALLYIAGNADPAAHDQAFRCLLQLNPEAYRQLPFVLGPGRS